MLDIYENQLLDGLTDRQQTVLMALMAHPTVTAAAKAADVSPPTVYRYKRDPVFRDAYRQLRKDAIDQATKDLEALAGQATATLKAVMEDLKASATAKVAAAGKVWALITKTTDAAEVEDLVDELRGEYGNAAA